MNQFKQVTACIATLLSGRMGPQKVYKYMVLWPPNRAKMEVGMYQTAIQGVAPGDGVIDECELL